MKPIQQYNGAAPQAMSLMGAGLSQAGANIGQIEQQKYAKMGEQIGGAISGVMGAIGNYQQQKSDNKAYQDLLKNPKAQELLGMDSESAKMFSSQMKDAGLKEGNKMFEMFMPAALKSRMLAQENEAQSGRIWEQAKAQNAYAPTYPTITAPNINDIMNKAVAPAWRGAPYQ